MTNSEPKADSTDGSWVGYRPFGILPTGETVEAYTLSNGRGCSAEVLTYGGIVSALRVPDRDGRVEDVVLGFDGLDRYLAGHPFFGAIVGRIAGRVREGRFTLGGRAWELARNDPPNHLHGGRAGFDKRLWAAEPAGPSGVRLAYRSPDGEEGYPGAVEVAVTYTLTPQCELVVETEATSDRPTPLSLTQHSYFNLAGEGSGSVADHRLQLHADAFVPTDEHMTLSGRRSPVSGGPNDFTRSRRLGDALPHLFRSHGDLYLVRRQVEGLMPAAVVSEPRSGRTLSVSTTEPCLQFYTGVSLDGSLVGKSGRPYRQFGGLCLECEGYPDALDTPGFGDILVRPGRPRRTRTVYAFSVESTARPESF